MSFMRPDKIQKLPILYLIVMIIGYISWGTIFVKSFMGLIPICGLLFYALKTKQTYFIWLSTACSLGNFIVWGFATFGLTQSNESFIADFYIDTWSLRGVYAFILITGVSLGTITILASSSIKESSHLEIKQDATLSRAPQFITLGFAIVYLFYLFFTYIQGNLLNRGVTSRTVAIDSVAYLIGGLTYLKFAFFYAFGSQTPKHVSNVSLVTRILISFMLSAPLFLSGGREFGIMCNLFFIAGIGLSQAGLKTAFRTGAVIIPLLGSIYIILGFLRQDFSEQTLNERLTSAQEFVDSDDAFTQDAETAGGPWGRVAEAGTHIVIDHIHRTGDYEGFNDFSRIYEDILPRFINPNRNVDNYGSVVLNEEYDITYSDATAAPLTTIAGAYRRWGPWGILIVGFFIGIILTLWNKFILRINPSWLRNLILCILTYYALRLYTKEVVALGNALTYSLFRNFLTIVVFSYGALSLQKLLQRKSIQKLNK